MKLVISDAHAGLVKSYHAREMTYSSTAADGSAIAPQIVGSTPRPRPSASVPFSLVRTDTSET